jgi:hypothetical protein
VGWEFKPHATLFKEARKEGVLGRGRPAKSAETIGEALGFKEELENKCSSHREMDSRVMIRDYK